MLPADGGCKHVMNIPSDRSHKTHAWQEIATQAALIEQVVLNFGGLAKWQKGKEGKDLGGDKLLLLGGRIDVGPEGTFPHLLLLSLPLQGLQPLLHAPHTTCRMAPSQNVMLADCHITNIPALTLQMHDLNAFAHALLATPAKKRPQCYVPPHSTVLSQDATSDYGKCHVPP